MHTVDRLLMNPRASSICSSLEELRKHVAHARAEAVRIGMVPTMGALHDGHLRLIETSAGECDFTVVSVFVNPTQFAPHEDFENYPRDLNRDAQLAVAAGADLVFAPSVEAMYPDSGATSVEPGPVAKCWEGKHRPDHFRGVATIVLKLFHAAAPDVAYFGRKDYQQSLVVCHMVRDLLLPVTIRVVPTVRDADGLALSSRNIYLSEAHRRQASAIPDALRAAVAAYRAGQSNADTLIAIMRDVFADQPDVTVDYLAVADSDTLQSVDVANAQTVLLVAARVGTTRLIDNCLLGDTDL